MLKFIGSLLELNIGERIFQNILCWSLSAFIPNCKYSAWVFQNILCWSLSDEGVCKSRRDKYFKTSYVEVYPCCSQTFSNSDKFQNILCWSLSTTCRWVYPAEQISKHLMLKFIMQKQSISLSIVHFKTSYVEVYPHIFSLLLSPFIYFPLHFSWFLSFLPSISPYSFSYPISHKFPDFTILSQHFSFFRLVNISTTHNQAWGARQMSSQLKMRDHKVSRSKTRLCMTKMGIDPIYPQIIIKHTITNLFFIFKAK